MKIDSSKSENQVQNNRTNKTIVSNEQASFLTSNKTNKLDFATVLKNTPDQNDTFIDNKTQNKSSESNKTHKENESDSKLINKNTEKNQKENNQNTELEDKKLDTNQDKSLGYIQIVSQTNIEEVTYPNARMILHVADLERIISSIRSQTFANGKQITIELKRSVFQGLELKLTVDKNRNVIAEFITANESVKSQLNEKAEELAGLLKDRGVKLGEIRMSLSSDSSDSNQKDSDEKTMAFSVGNSLNKPLQDELKDLEYENKSNDSTTSYQA